MSAGLNCAVTRDTLTTAGQNMAMQPTPTMKSIFGNGQIVPEACREPVVLHQPIPACLHNPTPSSGSGRLRFDLHPNYTAHPKGLKDFLRNIRCLLHR